MLASEFVDSSMSLWAARARFVVLAVLVHATAAEDSCKLWKSELCLAATPSLVQFLFTHTLSLRLFSISSSCRNKTRPSDFEKTAKARLGLAR